MLARLLISMALCLVAGKVAVPFELGRCRVPGACIDLQNCTSYMRMLVRTKNQPSHAPILKFLRSRLCDFGIERPMVCCVAVSEAQFSQFVNSTMPATKIADQEMKKCGDKESCINLMQCTPMLYLVNLEKQLGGKIVKSQQCGFEGDFPKVCCREDFTMSTTKRPILPLDQKTKMFNDYFDRSGFFDYIAFDLVRRKRDKSEKDELDIEIR